MFKRLTEKKSNGKEKTNMAKTKKILGIVGAIVGTLAGVAIGAKLMKKGEAAEVDGEYEDIENEELESTDESDDVE